MAENFIESEIISDRGVDSLQLRVDAQKLEAFQNTLKGGEARGMNAFITRLNALQTLNAKAEEIRGRQGNAIIVDRPVVAGVVVPVENTDPEISGHNDTIRSLHKAIQEFNASRNEFLSSFIARYVSPPVAVRNDPKPGERRAPRVERQVGTNFTLPTTESAPVALRPEDNKDYMRTLLAKNVDDMTEEEITIIRGLYQKVGFKDVYEKFISAGDSERDALKRMREAMKAANARDNSGWVNQGLIRIAQWLESKTNK